METTEESESFKPPRLEDAGLEDCALPPESIKEAFLKAAAAIRSGVSDSDDEGENEGRCVEDPWEDFSDAVVGISEDVNGPSKGYWVEGGGGVGDKVAVSGGRDSVDAVVGPGVPDVCVDGLQGLEIGERSRGILGKNLENGKNDVDDEDKPISAEGYAA